MFPIFIPIRIQKQTIDIRLKSNNKGLKKPSALILFRKYWITDSQNDIIPLKKLTTVPNFPFETDVLRRILLTKTFLNSYHVSAGEEGESLCAEVRDRRQLRQESLGVRTHQTQSGV